MKTPRNMGIITDIQDPYDVKKLELTHDEVIALLNECYHSYISYENPVARDVISRMRKFVEDNG